VTPRATGSSALGVVVAFDAREGLGRVELEDGTEASFHATQLTDGSRQIEVGTPVTMRLVPWHRGRREATAVTRR
jgi:hypothetical protein